MSRLNYIWILTFCAISACTSHREPPQPDYLFNLKSESETGIHFLNALSYTESFNPYTYRNFYNGGGVAIGDVNNDGLPDIYFTGNQVDNKLYLNKGNWKFEDITESAGVSCLDVWSSGVSMVDINGDGYLDIYVCKSGNPEGENRYNELFINNGDLTFTEQAKAYGIDDKGLSTHAAFFDYDKDGDLDCYLLNNSFRSVGGYDLRKGQREIRDNEGGNKLYRNDGDKFTDVSEFAGIYGSSIGFGLGVTIGDINRDGWQDIYVSNDFFERDYLYINQKDGTFSEELESQMPEISQSSMGADMADINNDGFPEVFVTDMLPEDDARMKTKTTFENWDKYQLNFQNGYHRQFTRNVLQLNNGNNTFSEIGRLANVFATDWSWGALIFDMDNDGLKDIFVANGIYKDLTDQDYIQYSSDPETVRKIMSREKNVITGLVDMMPSNKLPNYAFVNSGNLKFENKAEAYGLGTPSHSNGSAYGDLDNDGDLDLVINNIEAAPFIYENSSNKKANFISIELRGYAKNYFALGSQVTVYAGDDVYYQELAPFRGFESSVDPRLHFGLGTRTKIDSIVISWPDNQRSVLKEQEANQFLIVRYDSIKKEQPIQKTSKPQLFKEITAEVNLSFKHTENAFVDFDRDRLLYHMLSVEGPKAAKADVNGDGLEDIYIGGAKDMSGSLFIQKADGTFMLSTQDVFEKGKISEDTDCVFFDADNDGDADLYVASGGNEFPSTSSALKDRLYFNDGQGNFTLSNQILPVARYENSSCVRAADFDADGDIDLVVGIRAKPFLYGVPVNAYLLENDGKGKFTDVTQQMAPMLEEKGMFTAFEWADLDNDNFPELILAGEWMSVTILKNNVGKFTDISETAGLTNTSGFWNTIVAADLDNDGDIDFVAGNHGLNSRIKANQDQPVTMHVNDFDSNGTVEQIISVPNGLGTYPLVLRHDLVKQMPALKKKYLKYESYKEQTVYDIFSESQMEEMSLLKAKELKSVVFMNDGNNHFTIKALPIEAQFAPVKSILVQDVDRDGNKDLILGGNFFKAKPEVGIYAGSYGNFLKGDGKGNFSAVPARESGFSSKGEIRDFILLNQNDTERLFVIKNNDSVQVFEMTNRVN
ncbi:VCBS repeat-containing protein [Chondrinema litorale]|uniref:VCBS repeat-containing protein n=1 Tax=Chondrinema litorale TaxID=2994555 RepID=UPI002542D9A5|nr:VCBS repeat-containing protein [Chondrinema litorale]UZR95631.1 VCBS repeat-containing protein [Chondrinema litorale]